VTIEPYPIYTVSSLCSEDLEQLGNKPKYWYRDGDRRMMFKAEFRGTGEDWAERVACEICLQLGIPHVHYELAYDEYQKLPGVICENVAAKPYSLILGNQLLLERDPDYPADQEHRYKVSEHTVAAVLSVVAKLELPPEDSCQQLPEGISTALGVFVGYVMLDALVANQDRHHQNWGAVRRSTITRLAPSFDHGAGLARNEPDLKRSRRLDSGDADRQIAIYANKARSAFYQNAGDRRTLTTHDAFAEFSKYDPKAASAWISQLETVSADFLQGIVNRIPDSRISEVGKAFTIRLLEKNRSTLLQFND